MLDESPAPTMVDHSDALSACATRVPSAVAFRKLLLSEPDSESDAKPSALDLSALQEKLKILQARATESAASVSTIPSLDSDTDESIGAPSCDDANDLQPELPTGTAETEESMLLLSRSGDADDVIRVVEAAATAGNLNARMVNMALSAQLGAGRHPDGAASWMLTVCHQAGIAPTPACFNNLLGAYLKRGPAAAVLVWADRMRAHGVALDVRHCNHLLTAHAQEGDRPAVEALLGRMRDPDAALPAPDVVSFNIAIAACATGAAGVNGDADPERAAALLLQMRDVGLRATVASYSAVVHAWARAARPAEAQAWLERTFDAGVRPDAAVFNSVIAAHAAAADAAGARAALRRMAAYARDECPQRQARPGLVQHTHLGLRARGASRGGGGGTG